MNEIKNAIEIICNRADHSGGKKLENGNFEIIQKKEHRFTNSKESLCDLWLFINTHIRIKEIPEEKKKGAESLFKCIIAEKFPNLKKDLDIQI